MTRRGLDNRVPPPVVFLATALAMGGAAALLPPSGLAGRWSLAAATLLLALAGLAAPLAFRRFRRAGTTIDPVAIERASVLVTDGVYGWSRNPMYLSLAALLGSLAVFTAQPWLLLGPAAFVLYISRFQIVPEERLLRQRFGAAYDEYCARVRRWL